MKKKVQELTLTHYSTVFALIEMAVGHRHDTVFEMAKAVDEQLEGKGGASLEDLQVIEAKWGRRG